MTMMLAISLALSGLVFQAGRASGIERVSGRIGILYMGDPWSFQQNRIVMDWIRAEPRFELTIVPCDLEVMEISDAVRFTRLYLPRTYKELNLSYDILLPNNISPRVIETRILGFFPRAVEEDALGAYLVGFDYWGGTNDIGFWQNLAFYEVLPCDIDTGPYQYPEDGKIYYTILRTEPVFDLPGNIENIVMFENRGGDILPRPGSVVHAVWRGRGTPALVTGRYGEGITLQLDQAWNDFPVESMRAYRYFPDLIYNQIFFVVDVEPPDDLELVHRTREMFIDVRARRTVTVSLLEFVDMFGGKIGEIEGEIARLDDRYRVAERGYIDGGYLEASEILEDIMSQYGALEPQIARVKDRALAWIYASEWIAVSATSMLCGVFLWALMVRKSLYKEAGSSRLNPRQ
jgi:hypothetical protein